jgi:competence protein ComEA
VHPDPARPAASRQFAERARAWVVWFGIGRLVAVAVAVAVVTGGGFWLLRAPPPTSESTLPFAGASSSTSVARTLGGSASSAAPSTTAVAANDVVVVHVAGAVADPGVYHLPGGARVVDAVTAAGGLGADADGNAINLAAVLRDGERVYVPRVGEEVLVVAGAEPASTGTAPPTGPIDVNIATAADLDALPGVGPSTAAAIVAYRDQHGPFQTVDEIGEVRGIGPAKLEAIRGMVTV